MKTYYYVIDNKNDDMLEIVVVATCEAQAETLVRDWITEDEDRYNNLDPARTYLASFNNKQYEVTITDCLVPVVVAAKYVYIGR